MAWNCGFAVGGFRQGGRSFPGDGMDMCKSKYQRRVSLIAMILLIISSILLASIVPVSAWTGTWKEVPGGGVTDAAPAAVTYKDALYLFHKGMNTRIYFNKMDDRGSWGSWLEVPGEGVTDAAPAVADFGVLSAFYKGMNSHIYYNQMTPGGSWVGFWQEVSGNGDTDAALAAATLNNAMVLYVFHKGMNTRIYFNTIAAHGSWGSWREVPGNGVTDAALAAVTFNNVLYLFHKGMNTRIYFNTMDARGSWGSWREVPGNGVTDAALAATTFNNVLYLFHKGMNTRIYFNTMDARGSWGSWREVPGNGVTDAALAAAAFDNVLYLFHKGMNTGIYYQSSKGEPLEVPVEKVDIPWSGPAPGTPTPPPTPPPGGACVLTKNERQLADLINNYRKDFNLPPIPVSKSLTTVARAHVNDLKTYHPDTGNCNLHSWSSHGKWTPMCYTDDHAQKQKMWYKPREITGGVYTGYGFEIAHEGPTPETAINSWKISTAGHGDVIVEKRIWEGSNWKALGVAIDGGYVVAWFGSQKDPAGNCN